MVGRSCAACAELDKLFAGGQEAGDCMLVSAACLAPAPGATARCRHAHRPSNATATSEPATRPSHRRSAGGGRGRSSRLDQGGMLSWRLEVGGWPGVAKQAREGTRGSNCSCHVGLHAGSAFLLRAEVNNGQVLGQKRARMQHNCIPITRGTSGQGPCQYALRATAKLLHTMCSPDGYLSCRGCVHKRSIHHQITGPPYGHSSVCVSVCVHSRLS